MLISSLKQNDVEGEKKGFSKIEEFQVNFEG